MPLYSLVMSPYIAAVLVANALWLCVCTLWAFLCFSQAAADRRAGKGFQKPVGIHDID